MAMNPMQRRATRSFVIGFVIGIMIAVAVAFFFYQQVKQLKAELAEVISKQSTAPVAVGTLESGKVLNYAEDLMMSQVQTTVPKEDMLTENDFSIIDENGNLIEQEVTLKVTVPAGTIITKDMVAIGEKVVSDDIRTVEYSMINLPSEVLDGDYIDIRLLFPGGQDYVILGKKKVEKCTDTTIWIKQTEEEIMTLNNAIIDSYLAEGSKLYATRYTEPGIQKAAQQTYPVSNEVLDLIRQSPNIVTEAKNALAERYNSARMQENRDNVVNPALGDPDDRSSSVSSGISAEISSLQDARKEYLESMGITQ